MSVSTTIPHIVIVGGGAGGLELATNLGDKLGPNKHAKITLVDSSLTHIWKPLLHEVAAGTLSTHEDEVNYFVHGSKHYFEFQLGKMVDLNRNEKNIILDDLYNSEGELLADKRSIKYDYLIIAIGSQSNDFRTEGAKDHCIFIDSKSQAEKFQKNFFNLYLQARAEALKDNSKKIKNIIIIGAGATGVELAAELSYVSKKINEYGLSDLSPKNIKITLIEASKSILPILPAQVSNKAKDELIKFGVNVLTSTKVIRIENNKVYCEKDLVLETDLTVWSAGIKAPDFLKNIGNLESNHLNQLKIKSNLQTTKDEHIFAIGDCSSYVSEVTGLALPPRAQVASQQASFLSRAIINKIIYNQNLPEFSFKDKGSLISLSQNQTVGHIFGKFNIHGKIARSMYLSLYRIHQLTLHGIFQTVLLILKEKINKISRPKFKLH